MSKRKLVLARLLFVSVFLIGSTAANALVIYCGAICRTQHECDIDTDYCPNSCYIDPNCKNEPCLLCGMAMDPWLAYSK